MKIDKKTYINVIIILAIIILLFYILPNILIIITTTAIGNAILLLIALYLTFYENYRITLIYVSLWIIVERMVYLSQTPSTVSTEGFTLTPNQTYRKWTSQEKADFLTKMKNINPKVKYIIEDMEGIVSIEELNYFMHHNQWYWDKSTEALYKKQYKNNPYVAGYVGENIAHAKKIYSQSQINIILKEQQTPLKDIQKNIKNIINNKNYWILRMN